MPTPIGSSAQTIPTGVPGWPAKDKASAASFGLALEQASRTTAPRLTLPPLFEQAGGGYVQLDELVATLRETLDGLGSHVGAGAREARLRTPPPLAMGMGRLGDLVIDLHPQLEAFTHMLEARPEARRGIGRAIALKQILEAGHEAAAFQAAYRQDPDAALSRYDHLFGGTPRQQPKLLMAMVGGQPSFAFGSAFHAFWR